MSKVTIIADSINRFNNRITTFEIEFPRWILAEFNTHRQLSRNSASSRAIPISANIMNITENIAVPVSWGKNQPGMVAQENISSEEIIKALKIWKDSASSAIDSANDLSIVGVHKQIANRLIENFTYQKVVVTATEWDNYFWLRNHKDAQPEIKELAEKMFEAYQQSKPVLLELGEWHVPYVKTMRSGPKVKKITQLEYYDCNDNLLTLEEALKVSASCCAQVSYRKSDDSLEKAHKVFDMLNLFDESDETRKHASPVEHQATPIGINNYGRKPYQWDNGVTHLDRKGFLWSGNFKGWIQYRHLIPNESK